MIFVTVGTQFGFDRMVKYVDHWLDKNPNKNAFAQIADGKYQPLNMSYATYLEADKYTEIFSQADVIISHAGMGSILSALKKNKKIIVVPREYNLSEHRNDHQKDAIPWLREIQGIKLAIDEESVSRHLDDIYSENGDMENNNNKYSYMNSKNRERLQLAIYDLIKQNC